MAEEKLETADLETIASEAEKENQIVYHRLSKEDEESIFLFARAAAEANDIREGNSNHEKALKAFEKQLKRTEIDSLSRYSRKRLCYEHLPSLLEAVGADWLEMFNAISKDTDGNKIKVKWATDQEAKMCVLCDLLTDEDRERVLTLVRDLASEEVRKLNLERGDLTKNTGSVQSSSSTSAEEMPPVDKVAIANYLRSFGEGDVLKKTEKMGIVPNYLRRFGRFTFNAIAISLLAYVAAESDISLHWLIGLDEGTTLLAKNGRTETIMAYFCFLPDERKSIVVEVLSHI